MHTPRNEHAYTQLRLALLNHGVDCAKLHGWVSAVHTEGDVRDVISAYTRALQEMVEDHVFE